MKCYPCGNWVLQSSTCKCVHYDRFGYKFARGKSICLIRRSIADEQQWCLCTRKKLIFFEIDENGWVDYLCWRLEHDDCYTESVLGPTSWVMDVITMKPFHKLLPLAQYFLEHTMPNLQTLRQSSLILSALHFSEIKRLSLVSALLTRSLFASRTAFQVNDTILVSAFCMKNADLPQFTTSRKGDLRIFSKRFIDGTIG